MKSKKKKVKVKAIKKIRRSPLRYEKQEKQKHIPRDIKKMIEANWGKTYICHECGSNYKRIINLRRDEALVTVSHICTNCSSSLRTRTLPYPKKAKEMVRNSSPLGIKTRRGVKFICTRCNSDRLKFILKPENILVDTVHVRYECRDCGWGAMVTLNLIIEE